MNIGAIMNRARKVTADNAPAILTGLGVTGLVTTAILTGQASFKAAEVIREHTKPIDDPIGNLSREMTMTVREKVEFTWQYFIPAIGTGALAITCIIAANRIQTRRAAALASAYTLTQEFFKEYRGKVLEKLGDKQEKEISEAVAQDRANKAPFISKQVMIVDGQSLCFDTYTGRYFTSSVAAIREAVNEINFQINSSYFASLSDFYFMIGLEAVKESDDLGWNADRQLAVTYSGILGPNQQPAIALTFDVYPIRDYHRVH